MKTGLFITIEGIEGAGKSTVIGFIRDYLKERHRDVVITREPGGTEIAEAIRQLFLQHHREKMSEDTELLLAYASRAQHIAKVIKPALAEGKIVLSDRFSDASFAYQGAGRGIAEERIAWLDQWVLQDLQPDLTILLDVPAKIGLQRIQERTELDRFESEKLQFFERVRQGYLNRAKQFPDRYDVMDATWSLESIKNKILTSINKLITK